MVDPIAPITVPAGRTYQVPVTSTFDGPGGVSFRTSTSAGLSASVRPASNSWLDLKTSVGGFRFQLFDDAAPKTVRRFKGLVQSGFFNGLTFHRVISNLLAQGGDPAGNGTGGAESRFDDEFNPDLQFTGSGQLAMADVPATASGIIKDQNSSQFFVTRSPQRDLDYNFTLFGQLVTGFDKLKKLTQVQVQTGTDTPVSPPIIHRASIVTETRAAVVQLKANDAPGTRQLTVTAVGPDGAEQSRTVTVTVEANVVDAPPILSPIADVRAAPGSTVTLQLSALDLDGDDYTIGGEILSGGEGIGGSGAMLDQSAKTITLSLQPSFTGAIQLRVGVKQAGAVTRGSIAARPGDPPGGLRIYDTQVVTIAVGDRPLTQAQGIAAYYNEASQVSGADLALASFVDEDAQATEGDFSVAIDWGDGTVDDEATVEAIAGSPGTFRVVGRHAYPDGTTGSMPVSVYVVSTKGVRTTIDSSVVLNPTASFENGVVSVFGADIADEIDLYLSGTELRALVNGKLDRFTLSQVSRVEVRSFAGDDRITAAPGVPGGAFYAGAGNDTVRGTDYGDSIEGGDGRDYLDGGPGNDVLFGEGDNDTLTAGAGKNTLYGGDGDDRMNGSGGRDLAYGGDGNDRLYGNGGSDTLDGQSGSDRLWGGDGDDLLVGSGSIDRLWGNAGNDTLHGGTKTEDVLDGGDGTDTDGDQDDKDTLISIEA